MIEAVAEHEPPHPLREGGMGRRKVLVVETRPIERARPPPQNELDEFVPVEFVATGKEAVTGHAIHVRDPARWTWA